MVHGEVVGLMNGELVMCWKTVPNALLGIFV